ncbi:MAG: peptidase S8, partial [Albidovulum sp.]
MEKFVILRDASRGMRPEAIYPRPGPFGTAAGRLDLPPEPRVETADLSSAELRGAARDPEVVAVARAMPIRLIEPRGA